ncbi:MAG: flagellar hook-basal body complex protein FliE [Rhodobacteraceae bacterium HLUCCO07]|nr:MAG: flagellar hook-basal body complex protein FliE [Rhodobacteraceae bacterium HLUCCO07]
MDINALNAARSYAGLRPATEPDPGQAGGAQVRPDDAGGALGGAVRDFTETLHASEDLAKAAMTTGADPHALVHALAETEMAVETVVTVRDKIVEAYQEILRMPV